MQDLQALNPQQADAVLAIAGPLLVLAGAGAGKTKVIAERIKEIIRQGAEPHSVLAITFTNKAAGEMRQRIQGSTLRSPGLRSNLNTPFVSTFHSLGLTLIKEHAKLLGYKRAPAIYDRQDSLREIKRALKAVGAEDVEPRTALATISRNKGELISAEEFAAGAQYPNQRSIALAWHKYDAALREDGAMDFDDLLVKAVALLRQHPSVREAYQRRWRYLLIDEYQDTNSVQAELARLLVGKERNICAVGDIDQTIYSWRGAKIENLLRFEREYPGAKVVVLTKNYRSSENILQAANSIISKNINRVEKMLEPAKPQKGAPLGLYQAFDEQDEAGFVVRMVKEALRLGRRPREFAVLYRANFQSRALEEQFLAAGVEYQVLGTRFYERKEVKDVLSYLRAALYETPADIARAVETPSRGIGKVTLLKMLQKVPVQGAIGARVAQFYELLKKIRLAAGELAPGKLVEYVIRESGIERMLKEDKLEGGERLENLRELVSLAMRYGSVEEFLEHVALQSEQDEFKEERDAVRLMTVHAAKGLEFPTVFIVGLEEGLFPYESDFDEARDKEEERRLMYVALTRAKEKLYLTYASYRTVFGSKNATAPSQFLSDIPGELYELEAPERLGKTIYLD